MKDVNTVFSFEHRAMHEVRKVREQYGHCRDSLIQSPWPHPHPVMICDFMSCGAPLAYSCRLYDASPAYNVHAPIRI